MSFDYILWLQYRIYKDIRREFPIDTSLLSLPLEAKFSSSFVTRPVLLFADIRLPPPSLSLVGQDARFFKWKDLLCFAFMITFIQVVSRTTPTFTDPLPSMR